MSDGISHGERENTHDDNSIQARLMRNANIITEDKEIKKEGVVSAPVEVKRVENKYIADGKLCLGLIYDGEIHRDVSTSDFDGEAKAEMFRPDSKKNPNKAVTRILAKCVKNIGPYNRDDMKESKWLDIIRHLSIPDSDHLLLMIASSSKRKSQDIRVTCDNPDCGHEYEVSLTPEDIEVFEPASHLEISESGKYILRLIGEDPELDAVVEIPNRIDAEVIGGLNIKNAYRANLVMWNRMTKSINGTQIRSNGLSDDEFAKLDSDLLDEFMTIWMTELPGPERLHFTECEECGEELSFTFSVESFLFRDPKSLTNALKKKRDSRKVKR